MQKEEAKNRRSDGKKTEFSLKFELSHYKKGYFCKKMPLFARFLQKIVDVLQNYVDKSGKLCYNDYGAQERA